MGQVGKATLKQLQADVKKLPAGPIKSLAQQRCETLEELLEQGDLGRMAGLYKVTHKAVQEALA